MSSSLEEFKESDSIYSLEEAKLTAQQDEDEFKFVDEQLQHSQILLTAYIFTLFIIKIGLGRELQLQLIMVSLFL